MNDSFHPPYDVPWDSVMPMLAACAVTLVVLLILMLLAWRGWWPFNKE